MTHMRSFSKLEEQNIAYLVNHNISFTLVQVTGTGLKKSILDATAPMRSYFFEQGIHNYSEQLQGPNHKQILPTRIFDEQNEYQTKTSLYRPITKKGDPRLWIYQLGEHTHPDDIHAICVYKMEFRVINITRVNIEKSYTASELSPLKEFIAELYHTSSTTSEELLAFFKCHKGEWFEAEITADTGIGRTIETMLGIAQNSNKTPDYKGIELKSYREKRSSTKNVLFTQTPDWSLSTLKSGREIVAKYGYLDKIKGKKTYQNTVQCNLPNSQGLGLTLDQVKELLELQYFGTPIEDVAVWTLRKLHQRLSEKHRETFWIAVDNKYQDGKEYFRYQSIEHTRNPILPQFDLLLEAAIITVDLLLCRPSGHGDTYSFKIKKKGMPLLFPESLTYDLLS